MSNTGSQPLWLRLDSSGYPQSAPQPGGNVLGIERTIFDTQGSRNRCLHCAAANWCSSSWR
ncbi:alpha-2-macroglobulin [Klebsiella pneumoniae]|uniref:Alpha-2-macroglobulin n=1 Tax=Klebsiella pneumoniae TaxID=573 RepID=A0A378ADX9_KLEPN|nr:alpha-2-macroglobulin [Klebsiella pneumoniae]